MKNLKHFAAMAVMALSAMPMAAQFASTGNNGSTPVDAPDSYQILSVGYENFTMDPKGGDSESTDGVAIQYTSGSRIMDTQPLYFEWGVRASVGFWSDSEGKFESKLTTVAASIPLNVAYRLAVGETLAITPYTGLHARGNIIASNRREYDGDGKTYNMFDKDDVGSDAKWTRFQFGWQIGARVNFNTFNVGLEYGLDFNELCKKCKTSSFLVSVGFNI